MQTRYIMLGMAIFAMLIFYSTLAHSQGANVSSTNIGEAINSTAAIISKVNQSGYLIFYPNLTQAYSYLSLAKNESNINTSITLSLLAKASQSAQAQQALIDQYKMVSLYALVVFGFLLAALLIVLMKPAVFTKGKRKRK
jgi:hypothetical protein